jgi:hypothetical protein
MSTVDTLSLNRTEALGVRIHSGPLLIPVERFFNFVSELLVSKYFLPLTISCKTPINVDCNLYDQGRKQVGKSFILRGINNLLILNLTVVVRLLPGSSALIGPLDLSVGQFLSMLRLKNRGKLDKFLA